VAGIVEDDAKNLWLATAAGIYRVSHETIQSSASRANAALACKLMSEAKTAGEPAGSFGGVRALVSANDRLWFATSEGLVNVDSKRPDFDSDALPVYFERVSLNGRAPLSLLRAGGWSEPASNSAPLIVHGNLASLYVWFTTPRFSAPDRLRFDFSHPKPVTPGELERIEAAPRLQRLVAMRIQQIVEELHVELVVFHDQHGLAGATRLWRASHGRPAALLVGHAAGKPARYPAPDAFLHRFCRSPAAEFPSKGLTNCL
jgi:hypothetical protein